MASASTLWSVTIKGDYKGDIDVGFRTASSMRNAMAEKFGVKFAQVSVRKI